MKPIHEFNDLVKKWKSSIVHTKKRLETQKYVTFGMSTVYDLSNNFIICIISLRDTHTSETASKISCVIDFK